MLVKNIYIDFLHGNTLMFRLINGGKCWRIDDGRRWRRIDFHYQGKFYNRYGIFKERDYVD